jgi:hypothetical protein
MKTKDTTVVSMLCAIGAILIFSLPSTAIAGVSAKNIAVLSRAALPCSGYIKAQSEINAVESIRTDIVPMIGEIKAQRSIMMAGVVGAINDIREIGVVAPIGRITDDITDPVNDISDVRTIAPIREIVRAVAPQINDIREIRVIDPIREIGKGIVPEIEDISAIHGVSIRQDISRAILPKSEQILPGLAISSLIANPSRSIQNQSRSTIAIDTSISDRIVPYSSNLIVGVPAISIVDLARTGISHRIISNGAGSIRIGIGDLEINHYRDIIVKGGVARRGNELASAGHSIQRIRPTQSLT